MKRTLFTLTAYALLVSYPAYQQVSTWTNAALNKWAAQRVAMTPADANAQLAALEAAMPDHLKQPLPEKKQ